jgi:hypothetical protein
MQIQQTLNKEPMKTLFTFLFVILCALCQGQTPRLCLYEIFTGETCPPTAASNPALNALLKQPGNAAKMVAINWEVPIPSAPTPTWSLYKTNKTEIDWRYKSVAAGGYGYNVNLSPMGLIDGQSPTTFGAQGSITGYMNSTVIATAQSYTSAFSVSMSNQWDATFSALTLTVNIVATANYTCNGPLVFRTVMIERNVDFSVAPGSTGEKHFEHVAIASFPSIQAGTPMVPTWTVGQSMTFTLNCPLPAYVRDKSEVQMVGFIQDDATRKVAQAVRSIPTPFTNDIKIVSGIPSVLSCSTVSDPTIVVKNSGSTDIYSFTIIPIVNGVNVPVFSWTGTLTPGMSDTLSLPFTFTAPWVAGNNTVSCVAYLYGDNNQANNIFYSVCYVSFPPISLTSNRQRYCKGEEVFVKASGANLYMWNDAINAGDAFSFVANESVTVTVTGTSTLTSCKREVTIVVAVDPCLGVKGAEANDGWMIYPNPFSEQLSIQALRSDATTYTVMDVTGHVMSEGTLLSGTSTIDAGTWPPGMYFVVSGGRVLKVLK